MIWDATRFVPSAVLRKGGAGVGSFIYLAALEFKKMPGTGTQYLGGHHGHHHR